MTLSTLSTNVSNTSNGVLAIYPFTFSVLDSTHIEVREDNVLSILSYSVSLNPDQITSPGGSITYTSSVPPNGVIINISRNVPLTQSLDYIDYNAYPAQTQEDKLDFITMILQQLDNANLRSIKIPIEETANLEIPTIANRKNSALAFDASGIPYSAPLTISDGTTKAYVDTADTATKAYADTGDALLLAQLSSVAFNLIINPAFTINQRIYASATTLAAGAYGHDRWKAGTGGGDYSFTQLESSTTITIAAGKSLIQVVDAKNVRGGTYTLSWTGTAQARSGVDSATPSGAYAASPLTISSQTAGTVMSVEFDAGTLGEVKLEEGSNATAFLSREFAQEFAICRRYARKSYNLTTALGAATSTGAINGGHTSASITNSQLWMGVHWGSQMRAPPTVTIYSTLDGATGNVFSNGANANVSGTALSVGEAGFVVTPSTGTLTSNQSFAFHYLAISEL